MAVVEREPYPAGPGMPTRRHYPIVPDDVPALMQEAGLAWNGDAQDVADYISKAALAFLGQCRTPPPLPAGEIRRQLQIINSAAAALRGRLDGIPYGLLSRDIGWAPPLLVMSGLDADAERTDPRRAKDAAEHAYQGLANELPWWLDVLETATRYEIERLAGHMKQGRRSNQWRDEFVFHVMGKLQLETSHPRGATSRDLQSSRRYGPGPQFLAGVCRRLSERLMPSELDDAGDLGRELEMASDAHVAGIWIESAYRRRGKGAEE